MRGLKILVVEDDDDTRELLTEFFSTHGYVVTAVCSAEEGLDKLRNGAIDLVVSDNHLDGGETGSWMLRKASSSGLLRSVGALMYTADRHLEVPSNVRVLSKPTTLDELERAAQRALAAARGHELERARRPHLARRRATPFVLPSFQLRTRASLLFASRPRDSRGTGSPWSPRPSSYLVRTRARWRGTARGPAP